MRRTLAPSTQPAIRAPQVGWHRRTGISLRRHRFIEADRQDRTNRPQLAGRSMLPLTSSIGNGCAPPSATRKIEIKHDTAKIGGTQGFVRMKVIIAGGGIGGLMTALMLHARGIDCEVFEQADAVPRAWRRHQHPAARDQGAGRTRPARPARRGRRSAPTSCSTPTVSARRSGASRAASMPATTSRNSRSIADAAGRDLPGGAGAARRVAYYIRLPPRGRSPRTTAA